MAPQADELVEEAIAVPGTRAGGLKAAQKNKATDPDFYRKIALKAQASWDANGRAPRGFAADHDLAIRAGSIGGRKSRRQSKDDTDFIKFYKQADNVDQVSVKFNISHSAVYTHASRLRAAGVDLPPLGQRSAIRREVA